MRLAEEVMAKNATISPDREQVIINLMLLYECHLGDKLHLMEIIYINISIICSNSSFELLKKIF